MGSNGSQFLEWEHLTFSTIDHEAEVKAPSTVQKERMRR